MLRFPRFDEDAEPRGVETKVLLSIIEKIRKQNDKNGNRNSTTLLGDSVFSQPRTYISSGILPVDCVVCFGMGFPPGIVEIYGAEATIKSAIMEETLAESQRKEYYTILFPTEYSLDYRRAKNVGLDEKKLLICEVETVEDVYAQLRYIVQEIRKKDPDTPIVAGWDSVAATPTRSELANKAGLEASDMGRSALQMSKLFRRLVRFLFVNKVCLLCVNQTRSNLRVQWGNKESTYGGKALRFYAWVRCRMSRIKTLKNKDDEKIGYLIRMECVKNKIAPPERSCIIPIYFDRGIDKVLTIWEYCVEEEIFTKKGTAYRYDGSVMTRKTFPKFYRKHKKEIDAACRKSTVVKVEE
jgi:recombination protein RecA